MDRILKPSRLDTDPSSPTAAKEWKHWYRTFTNFIEESGESAPNKLRALVNCVSPSVFEIIEVIFWVHYNQVLMFKTVATIPYAYVAISRSIFR